MSTTCDFTGSAAEFLPARRSLTALSAAAQACHGCPLYCHATQAVFGTGPRHALLMLVGEQPGDHEDLEGAPFVGPAGRELDTGLAAAGLSRKQVYLTNAVKHFKFNQRGKRRIHAKPNRTEIVACQPWLLVELPAIQPVCLVLMGASAAQSLLGSRFRVTRDRGKLLDPADFELLAPMIDRPQPLRWVVATVHPSSLLRMPERAERHAARAAFAADLRQAAAGARRA
jgi:DNA polymerase